jgi:hypothetical protein
MANPKAECRLEPIDIAYLNDLAKLGGYGKGRAGVIKRFIQNGIVEALEKGVIAKRSVDDFLNVGPEESQDADDDD